MSEVQEKVASKEVSKLVLWLRACERSPATPGLVVKLINYLRISGDFERRLVRDPLRSVPEFAHRVSLLERVRYGNEVRTNQAIADALLFGVEYVCGAAVEGDVAEFGTMTGRTATVISAALASFRRKCRLQLFDGFQGLPAATAESDKSSFHVKDGVWDEGTCQGVGPSALRNKCRRFLDDDQIVIHAGWYADTVKKLPDTTRFGMIHVDCDLYQSTMDALDPLFARGIISEGAVLFFDDWNCNRSRWEMGERKAWRELTSKHQIEASDGGDYSWGGHKMIVHKYRTAT